MRPAAFDPLLQPSLSENDDGHGFRQPWDPSTLGWIAILVGPFGAAWLMWRNQARLGLRGGARPALLMSLVGVAVIAVGVFVVDASYRNRLGSPPLATVVSQHAAERPATGATTGDAQHATERAARRSGDRSGAAAQRKDERDRRAAKADRDEAKSVVRFVGNVVALPLAWWLLGEQRRRFRIAQQCKVPTGELFGPGLLAYGVNFLVVAALVVACLAILAR